MSSLSSFDIISVVVLKCLGKAKSKGHLPGPKIFLCIPASAADAAAVSPSQDGPFGAAQGCGGVPNRPRFPKICHTYPALMKLGTVMP